MAASSVPAAGPGRAPGATSDLGAQNAHVTEDIGQLNLQAETFTQELSCHPGGKKGRGSLLKWKIFIYETIE